LPDPAGILLAVRVGELAKVFVRLLHEERGARGRAPSTDSLRLQQRHGYPCFREDIRGDGSGDAAPDNHDVYVDVLLMSGKAEWLLTRSSIEPERLTEPELRHELVTSRMQPSEAEPRWSQAQPR
jgi:hypothetical protein